MTETTQKTPSASLSRAIIDYVEFISPPNNLKAKVGTGGLSEMTLHKADKLMESYAKDYPPVATLDLIRFNESFDQVNKGDVPLARAKKILSKTVMDLKSNGAMFNYPIVSRISTILLEYISQLETFDQSALDIIQGHYDALRAVIDNQQSGAVDKHGEALILALTLAVDRYFKKKTATD